MDARVFLSIDSDAVDGRCGRWLSFEDELLERIDDEANGHALLESWA